MAFPLRANRPFFSFMRGLGCCALLSLAGCSFVPAYHTPDVPSASSWRAADQPGAAARGGEWWREFHDDALNALVDRGLRGNYTLAAAVARVEQARGSAAVAGAGQYPQVTLDGNYQRQNNYSTTAKRSISIGATYEVDFWGKQQAIADSADELVSASAFDAQTVHMTLAASITDSYFQVRSLDRRIALAQRIVADAQQLLDLVQVQANLGAASDLEVAQQRNVLETYQGSLPALQEQRDQALYQLAVLVGTTPQGFSLAPAHEAASKVPAPALGLPVDLLAQRPDIQAAEARLKSVNFDIGAARAAFLPNVSLNLLGGLDTLGGGSIWSAVGTVSQPLFTGGLLNGQLTVTKAHAQELLATYRELWIEALQDVQTQISASQQSAKSYSLNTAAVASAREASRLAQVRYRLGATDFQTLLIAERTQYQAEDALLQIDLQQLQAAVGLFRALGGDFDPSVTKQLASHAPAAPLQTETTR
ncbi:efflux transporter outer membrane subunit [Pseudomonas sp. HS6-2]|jgi:NodT family efflux transporter outer membrane factor (OMF) lipoprotein|uniref:efflux transporter outer membrane subunit n=1 Tax=Pseudomonas sp. HS6-2 TaxID=3410986 RepID=UPI003BBE1B3F